MIFITQANWVNGYGARAVHLVEKGYLPSLLEEPESVEAAVTIGIEWLGRDHPAVQCLRYGVAVHHGKLPSPFLREVERLLASGRIKITAASPTLAQGLNLNAAVLLVPHIVRQRERISGEELSNVAGRAGRAFVDTEGLVLHVMYDSHDWRRDQWRELVTEGHSRSITSGLMTVIDEVIRRLSENGIEGADGYEYLANSREAWLVDTDDSKGEPLEDLVAKADSIVLGLVEALDSDAADLPVLLEDALSGSLWARQLERRDPGERTQQMRILTARARLIWTETTAMQRRGHFAMGVGMETGLEVDAMADALAEDLDRADTAALQGNENEFHDALVRLGRSLLAVRPFAPDALDDDWIGVLRAWIGGGSLSVIGSEYVGLIEDAFIYRFVWALEAVRVRRTSHGWEPEKGTVPGAAAACVDTGLPDYRMSLLVRGGLTSREAAQSVVNELDPEFFDGSGMRRWLASRIVADLSDQEDWPSASTVALWRRFRSEALGNRERAWRSYFKSFEISELDDVDSWDGALVRVEPDLDDGGTWLTGPDFRKIGWFEESIEVGSDSVVYAEIDIDEWEAHVRRIGPDTRAGMI